jgi:hypothetical protein
LPALQRGEQDRLRIGRHRQASYHVRLQFDRRRTGKRHGIKVVKAAAA